MRIKPKYFQRIKSGFMTFITCNNYTAIQSGDVVVLREWDEQDQDHSVKGAKGFTDEEPIKFKVGFVLGSDPITISLLPLTEAKKTNGKARA